MKFFTADLHLAHQRILDKDFSGRPFKTLIEHDDYIIDRINAYVDARDELFVLGDFCWSPAYRKPGHFRNRINCRTIHLIRGNHDKPCIETQFSTVDDVRMVKIGTDPNEPEGGTIQAFLSHYPHSFWPASHYGALHCYGHLHDAREQTLDTLFPGRRSLDVGVDTAKRLLGDYRPFSDQWLVKNLWSRPGHDSVEWYKQRRGQK